MAETDAEVYDIDLMKSLIEQVANHPTLDSTCASCGVDPDTVRNWIRRGRMFDAPNVLQRFAMAMQRAEGRHASELYLKFLELIDRGAFGASAAKILLEVLDRRWGFGKDRHLLDIGKSPKRTDDLKSMFLRPSPRIRALLHETGWRRDPGWQPPVPLLRAAPDEEQ